MSDLIEVKTIGEVERTVHASGLWDGTGPVEFSDDGDVWRETWAPRAPSPEEFTYANPEPLTAVSHPEFARVTVYRKDVRIPTTVTIRWDEQYPAASEEWAGKWDRSPMRHFGRTVRMVAFRQTFRDLLGDTVIEDEERASAPAAPEAPAARDWAAEIASTKTVEALDAVVAEARAVKAFRPDQEGTALWSQQRAQRKALAALAHEAWAPAPAPEPDVTPAHREIARPQDRLPSTTNRAARRAASRKRGNRR